MLDHIAQSANGTRRNVQRFAGVQQAIRAVALLGLAAFSQSAAGQLTLPPPEYSGSTFVAGNYASHPSYVSEYRDGRLIGTNPDPACDTVHHGNPLTSWCWFNTSHSAPIQVPLDHPHHPHTSPWGLNLDLDVGIVAGDYPPLTRDVRGSTNPLIPANAPSALAALGLPERQALENQVDLITGVPLLQEVGLEIPFGTAVFRHVRTYSEPPSPGTLEYFHHGADSSNMYPNRLYWDWCGHGWMISENPILLIDANWWGISDPADGVNDQRIYFLPDAHQSIPFIFSDLDGTYVAPPRFDAILSHNGVWVEDHWSSSPTEFRVWLHGASVMYTFQRQLGDVGFVGSTRPYEPPATSRARVPDEDVMLGAQGSGTREDGTTGGFGTPHWALCTRIEDREGNAIRITHCDFTRVPCDHPVTPGWEECCQSCRTKGQIAYIQLCAPHEDPFEPEVVQWTLVYVHRTFNRFEDAELSITPQPDGAPLSPQTALVSVLAYRGDVADLLGPSPCPLIEASAFDAEQFGTIPFFELCQRWQNIDGLDVLPLGLLHDEWTHHVRYMYLDNEAISTDGFAGDQGYDTFCSIHNLEAGLMSAPSLLLASRFERPEEGEQIVGAAHWAYRGRNSPERNSSLFLHSLYDASAMQAAWSSEALATLRGPVAALYPVQNVTYSPAVSLEQWTDAWPLSHCFVSSTTRTDGEELHTTGEVPFLLTADSVLLGWEDLTGMSPEDDVDLQRPVGRFLDGAANTFPKGEYLVEMIEDFVDLPLTSGTGAPEGPAVFEPGGIGLLVSGAPGSQKFHRVYRFLAYPGGFVSADPGVSRTLLHLASDGEPMLRSIWHEPYRFYESTTLPLDFNTVGNYTPGTEILHVAVIDEYESLPDAAYQSGGAGDWDLTLAQMCDPQAPAWERRPLSRRVVRMNAAGYVLSEETWDFSTGAVASSGLREHFVYEEIPRLNPPDPMPTSGHYARMPGVRIKEYRTYSWDAARRRDLSSTTNHAATEGLTYVFAYDDSIDSNTRIGAIGVRRGDGPSQPVAWTNIWVRDANRPDHVAFEIQVTDADAVLPNPAEFWDRTEWSGYLTCGPSQSQAGLAVTWRGAVFESGSAGFGLFAGDMQASPSSTSQTPAVGNMANRIIEQYAVFPPSLKQDGQWYFPVEVTFANYAASGTAYRADEQWRCVGAMVDPPNPDNVELVTSAPHAELYTNFTRTWGDGTRILTVADVADSPPSQPVYGNAVGEVPVPPWERPSGQAAALNEWVVTFVGPFGVSEVTDHTRRRMTTSRGSREAVWHPEPETWMGRTARFNDIELDENGIVIDVHSAGEQTWEQDGEVKRVETVIWDRSPDPSGPSHWGVAQTLSVMVPDQDGSGRLVALHILDASSSERIVSAAIKYDRYGEVTRERHPDGTIVRNVADFMGRLERVYRGSRDVHYYWGTTPPLTSNPPPTLDDDMVLTEKHYYGDGGESVGSHDPTDFNNTRRQTASRRYRDAAASVYASQPGYPNTDAEDSAGWAETYWHDWRGRQAVVIRHQVGGGGAQPTSPILSQTHTFYDNADRPILVATYGQTAPPFSAVGLNPASILADCTTPTPAELMGQAAGYSLRRLSQTIYNPRGLVEEQRDYDVSDPSGESYLTTVTFYDHAGRPVHTRGPTGTIQTFVYDALGRQIRSATGVDLDGATGGWDDILELSCTETTYGTVANGANFYDRGKPITTISRERRHDAAASPLALDDNNSIATYTFNWHNLDGTLSATASLGTGSSEDPPLNVFSNSTSIPDRPEVGPTWELVGNVPTLSVTDPTWPTYAKVTAYEYDDQKRQTQVVRPDGTCTTNEYDDLGRLLLVTENAWGPQAELAQTAYKYDEYRLVMVAALANPSNFVTTWDSLNWTSATGWQITEFKYGAPVVFGAANSTGGAGGLGQPQAHTATANSSRLPLNPSLISAIHFPDHATGLPRANADLSFEYFPDGLLARRTDARGVEFSHQYDELSNRHLTAITNGDDALRPYGFADPGQPGVRPEDLINRILYAYDAPTGELLSATAETFNGSSTSSFNGVASSVFEYHERGDLLSESQQHGAGTGTNPAGVVAYSWDYSTAHGDGQNFNRLEAMLYPLRRQTTGAVNAARRQVDFHYGDEGGSTLEQVDHAASRVSRLADSVLGPRLAEFEYAGSMRRIGLNRGWITALGVFAAAQTFDASASVGGYESLDRFGRAAEIEFRGPASSGGGTARLHDYRYAYDAVDQPVAKLVEQATHNSQSHFNQRSWLYRYDGLHRLAAAEMGALSGVGTATPSIGGSTLHPTPRGEDWSLDSLGNWSTRTISPIPGDTAGTQTTNHDVDLRNELEAVATSSTGGSGGPTSGSQTYVYDIAGNLVLDDAYWYQYDGWGRLAKVSARNDLVLDSTGRHVSGSPGDWIVHHTYDGLGRLARLQRPLSGYPGSNHVEHYYYDGVRRIQEVVHGLDASGASEEGSSSEGSAPNLAWWAEREYIHTAGPGSYVDEYVCEVGNLNTTQIPLFHLQDANYNVLGLVSAAGQVVRQHTFDAYGQLLHAEDFTPTIKSRVGHQGLFFTRLDAPQGNPELTVHQVAAGINGAAPITRPVAGMYFTPNRTYSPGLGRWLQRDPNGTGGLTLDEPYWFGGARLPVPSLGLAAEAVLRDGANLTGYAGQNPVGRTDPTGLFMLNLMSMAMPSGADFIKGALTGLVSGYAANMEADTEWGEDWSMGDDWHSRGDNDWMPLAILMGVAQEYPVDLWEASQWIGSTFPGVLASRVSPGGRGIRNAFLASAKHSSEIWARLRKLQVGRSYHSTIVGPRAVDAIKERPNFTIAYELKTGRVRLTAQIQRQIDADEDLLRQGHYDRVRWLIRPSLLGGPAVLDPAVERALRAAGIQFRLVQ